MYNRTEKRWLESTYSTVGEEKVLFSRNVEPGVFGLSMALKENFLVYWTQFVFLTWLVPGNMITVTIDMCGKNPITGEWIYGITWKHVYFNISVLFIVDTGSILKLVFPITYCVCLDSQLSGCVVVIMVVVIAFFSVIVTVIPIFVIMVIITTVTFVMYVIFYCKYCR